MSRPRKYTDEHEAYMVEHYHTVSPGDIAKVIGAKDANAVICYATHLRVRKGVVFKREDKFQRAGNEPHKVIDYPKVPWHMRITNRHQGHPDMNYNLLGERGLDVGDIDMVEWLKE